MRDAGLFIASLRVASAIMTGLASALLIEIPLTQTAQSLTANTILCILVTVIAVQIERYLHDYGSN